MMGKVASIENKRKMVGKGFLTKTEMENLACRPLPPWSKEAPITIEDLARILSETYDASVCLKPKEGENNELP